MKRGSLVLVLFLVAATSFAQLVDMNSVAHREGSYVFTIWSSVDEVIGYGTIVYGQSTCRIPGQNGERNFPKVPYGHIGSKDQTGYYQLRMVRDHATN